MVSLVLNVNLLLAYYPQHFARSGHLSENSIRDYALCFVLSQEVCEVEHYTYQD